MVLQKVVSWFRNHRSDYRAHGVAGLQPKGKPGRKPRVSKAKESTPNFKQLAGCSLAASQLWAKANQNLINVESTSRDIGDRDRVAAMMYVQLSEEEHKHWEAEVEKDMEKRNDQDAPFG